MRNGDAMTKPVDLDALDAAHARLGTLSPDYWQEEDGDYIVAVVRTVSEHEAPDVVPDDDADGSSDPWYWARSEASTTATNAVEILNAYPAMAAELRERRAREEAHDAELRALREVAEAASEVAEYHRVYGTETIQDVNVDALRAALAKVPR